MSGYEDGVLVAAAPGSSCSIVKLDEQHCTTKSAPAMLMDVATRSVQSLRLDSTCIATRSTSAFFLHQTSNANNSTAASASPFSMPMASLVGALQSALPPPAVSAEDAALFFPGQPQDGAPASKRAYAEQDCIVRSSSSIHDPQLAQHAPARAPKPAQRRAVLVEPSVTASAQCSDTPPGSKVNVGPGPGGLSEPVFPTSCSKARLISCATSLAGIGSLGSFAAATASQNGSLQAAAPPHGVKAVCGKRAKMEDTFSVQCNFLEMQMAIADTVDYANKLPARIASQVGEQLEVQVSSLLPQPSPPTSVPLSPNSTCVPSLSNSDQDASIGGGSITDTSDNGSTSGASSACSDTLHFFAVYDGHGGTEAAQHCANRLHYHLSAALAVIAGSNVNGSSLQAQEAFCMANRVQGMEGASIVQCDAEWALCSSPNAAAADAELAGGPERSADTVVGPPPGMMLFNHHAAAAAAAVAAEHDTAVNEECSRVQQAVDRLFRSSDGVLADNPPTVPSPPPVAAATAGASAPQQAQHVDDVQGHDASSNGSSSSSDDPTRSESAANATNLCMSEALEAALRSAFLRTDEEFAEDGSSAMVGSTAVVALVGSKKLWIANCGDSRAVLCRGGRAIQVTDDHKPEREDEAARVEKAGGQVLYWNGHRVMGVLAMSRAIGDHGLRPFVIPEPEITVLSRVVEDDFLLLASDGLWDVMTNQEAITLAMRCLQRSWDKGTSRKAAVRVAATVLTRAAVDRGSKDNVTVVIIDLKAPSPGSTCPANVSDSADGTCATATDTSSVSSAGACKPAAASPCADAYAAAAAGAGCC